MFLLQYVESWLETLKSEQFLFYVVLFFGTVASVALIIAGAVAENTN